MSFKDKAKQAGADAASHVFEWLLPEAKREAGRDVASFGVLIGSSIISPNQDLQKQIARLRQPHRTWDFELPSDCEAEFQKVIQRFLKGVTIDSLEREYSCEECPSAIVLARDLSSIQRHVEALSMLCPSEIDYDYQTREEEVLLTLFVWYRNEQ